MKFFSKHIFALNDALRYLPLSNGCGFNLDDDCWASDGSCTSVSLYRFNPADGSYVSVQMFDLLSPEWTPALLLLACLRSVFPDRDCVALVKLRNKLFNEYFQ